MSRSRLLYICAVLLCTFALAVAISPAWGQAVATGTIVGTVTDNSGAVVAGANVTLVDKATGDSRSTTTNDVGHFIFQNVPPGSYTIKFKKSGFAETDISNATVQVGAQLNENVQMKLGSVSTTVTVTETAGAELQTMNATVGNTVSGVALDALPALGRDASTFVTLQPGVSPDGSVAGAVVDQSTFLLDGGQNSNDMDGSMNVYTPSFANDPTGGIAGGGPTGVMPTPIDSVEEFKVNTANQTADFNSSAGAQVEMVTRRGTNQWHGSGYDYYLDNNFNANSWDNNNSGTARPSFHYSRFGVRVGGPIIPKEVLGGKTYWFANYQGFRWPNSATITRAVPSQNMRNGILTFGGVDYNVANYDPRGIGINPVVQAMWNKYMPQGTPGASCADAGGGTRCDGVNEVAFRGNMAEPYRDDFLATRLDHDFGSKWHFNSTYRYYRFFRATGDQIDIGGAMPGDTLGTPTALSHRPQQPWYFTAGMTTNISPNVTNDVHYSFLRNFWAWETGGGPPIPGTGATGAIEPLGESASEALIPYNVNAQQTRTRFWDGQDNMLRDDVTVLHGNHLFQFGGTYQRNWNYHQRTDNGGGINYFLTYQLGDSIGAGQVDLASVYAAGYNGGVVSTKASRDFAAVTGMVTDSQIAYTRSGSNLTLNPPHTPASDKSTIPYYNVYFSDSWHLKPSVTLTYGLGWTLEMPPVEQSGKQIELVDATGQLLDVQSYLHQRERAALAGQVYNPEVGFELVGNTENGRKYPYDPYYGSFSPRVAVAWNPQFQSGTFASKLFGENNTVIRGGYNRIYGRLNGVDLVLVPLLGTGLIQAVKCTQVLNTSPLCGAGSGVLPTATTAFRIGIDGNTAPIAQASPTLPQPDFPGVNAATAASGESLDPHFRPNVADSFDLSIQRQFGPKMIMELGYIGRRITHEYQPININAVPYMMTLGGQTFAQAYAAIETAMGCASANYVNNCGATIPTVSPQPFFETALAGTGYCTGFANCTTAVVNNESGNLATQSVWSLWSDLDQGFPVTGNPGFNFPASMLNSPSAIAPGGQLQSGVGVNASVGFGNYNGAFVSFKTTDWHGITSQQNFTFSKALGTGAFVQATSEYAPNDPFNLKQMYGRQGFDVNEVYDNYIVYSPSLYKGQNGLVGRALGGWSFAPIFTAGSGYPLYCNTQTDAQAFGSGDGNDFFDNEQCLFTTRPPRPSAHITKVVDPVSGQVSHTVNDWANPDAVAASARAPILGLDSRSGGVGQYSQMPYWNMDFQIKKMTKISERFSVETQFLFTNVFNHVQYSSGDQADLSFGPTGWGDVSSQANAPRQLEFGIRLNW